MAPLKTLRILNNTKKQIYRKPVKTVYFHIYSRGVSFASVLLSTP
nr:MAG TPA: hypothetical protein [Caudoviricetes sp.]DAY15939.1 MAG TPA: hypothetical protein [Caudoviricetes sp.]